MINEYLMYYKEAAATSNNLQQDGGTPDLPAQSSRRSLIPKRLRVQLHRRRHPDQPEQGPNYIKGLYRNALDEEMANTKRLRSPRVRRSAIRGFGQGAVEGFRPLVDLFYNNPRKAINSLAPTRRRPEGALPGSLIRRGSTGPVEKNTIPERTVKEAIPIEGQPGGGWV